MLLRGSKAHAEDVAIPMSSALSARQGKAGAPVRIGTAVWLLLVCVSICGFTWKARSVILSHRALLHASPPDNTVEVLTRAAAEDMHVASPLSFAPPLDWEDESSSQTVPEASELLKSHDSWLYDADPPRVKYRDMKLFRHHQFLSQRFNSWVAANLHPLTYDEEAGMFAFRWNEIPDPIPDDENEIILLTQSTISRLAVFESVAKEWGGPVSLSVFIPFKLGTHQAASCRQTVQAFAQNLTSVRDAGPLTVSVLYAKTADPMASCVIPRKNPNSHHGKEHNTHAATAHAGEAAAGFATQRTLLSRVVAAKKAIEDHMRPPPFRDVYDAMYPVNRLRNLAWSQLPKRGAFVFLLDVDFIPTRTLYTALKSGQWASKLRSMRKAFVDKGRREALIVAAYERLKGDYTGDCAQEDDCDFIDTWETPRSMQRLRAMTEAGLAQLFSVDKFPIGHGCYDSQYWLTKQAADELVAFNYTHPCEPYAIGLSEAMPRYDEHFRGRGMNKVEQLTHMAMWGFQWELLPQDFVFHMPHPSTVGAHPAGGLDRLVAPLVLMKHEIREIEREPQFRMRIKQPIPSATR